MTKNHAFNPTTFDHLESREVLSTIAPVAHAVALAHFGPPPPPFHRPFPGTGVNTGPGNIGPGNNIYYGHR
jgi:hypothetical protein